MNTYGTTMDGQTIDDALVERLAANAEAGFPGAVLRPGRPPLTSDSAPSITRTVRLPKSLDAALQARASADHRTASVIVREALAQYLIPA